jgi:hypothetical protein
MRPRVLSTGLYDFVSILREVAPEEQQKNTHKKTCQFCTGAKSGHLIKL